MKILLIFAILYLVHNSMAELEVKLSYGTIRGRSVVTKRNVTFYSFQQVPYAAPPVGNLRLKPPQPPKKFDGVLDCKENTKVCYKLSSNSEHETEDCLYLNVYTPVKPGTNANLPVMVFFHGGGYVDGDATFNSFGPHYLVEKDLIVVTPAYRLGLFGFITTDSETIKGNNGLRDQTMALKWVQENIGKFGGDKNKVGINGHSAGSSAVTFHVMSKQSAGLFRAAIGMSGSALNPWSYQRNAKEIAFQVGKLLDPNFKSTNEKDLLNLLMKAKAKDLDLAANKIHSLRHENQIVDGFYFTPSVEPNYADAFISEKFHEKITKGGVNNVTLFLTFGSEEFVSFAGSNHDNFKNGVLKYENDVRNLVPPGMNIKDDNLKKQCGAEIKKIYVPDGSKLTDKLGAAVKFFSDSTFNRGCTQFAEVVSKFINVYFMQLSYKGPMGGGTIHYDGADEVGHGDTPNYVFAHGGNDDLSKRSKEDLLTHQRMITMFVNFYKDLNPTPKVEDLFNKVVFEKVQPGNFNYIDLNSTVVLHKKEHPKSHYYDSWQKIYQKYGKPPYITY